MIRNSRKAKDKQKQQAAHSFEEEDFESMFNFEQEDQEPEGEILVTTFTEQSAQKFRKKLFQLSQADEEKPIILVIDSLGGEIYALLSMIDAIDSVPNPIVTVCIGKAFSCGALLLSYGDKVFATQYSRIMLHEASAYGIGGNINDIKNDMIETEKLNKITLSLLADKTGLTADEIKKLFSNEKRDVYLSAEDAKSLKLVDEIGYPKLKMNWEVFFSQK